MRLVARLIIGVAVVLILTGAALFLLRKPIAGAAVVQVMSRAGLEKPSVRVSDVNFSRLTLFEMRAGGGSPAPDLLFENVSFEYGWRDLIFRGKLVGIAIDGGAATASFGANGAVNIAGWSPEPTAKPASPPFERLAVKDLRIVARLPRGPASFLVDGAFDMIGGGTFSVAAKAEETGFDAARLASLEGRAVINLLVDGQIKSESSFKGDVVTDAGLARDVSIEVSADLSSWRGVFGDGPRAINGAATVDVRSATFDANLAPILSQFKAASGAPIAHLAVSGAFKLLFAEDLISVSQSGGPLKITADRGDVLVLASNDGPLYARRPGEERLNFRADLSGPVAAGFAAVDAVSAGDGPWRVDASARFGEQSISGVRFSHFAGAFTGEFASNRLRGRADIDAHVARAEIGRLSLTDMPASARLAVDLDVAGRTLTASPEDGGCLDADRANFRFADQDMDARVSAALLCPGAAPLAIVSWGEGASTRVEGDLIAKSAHYRLGKTIFDGAPPRVSFKLDYLPHNQSSRIVGAIAGGNVLLNNSLILTDATGDFESDLIKDTVSAAVVLSSMRIAQNAELEKVAPVLVAGDARLSDDIATFDFNVTTPKGAPLGRGEGWHEVKTGRGEAIFDSGALIFGFGLQPDRLLPALRGVISNATGSTEGRARFEWAPDEMQSAATVNLDSVSFGGPGVAVTKTEGVTGKLVFSGLAPAATAGEQSLSIRKIDLDALKLENGELRFSFPGDGTLRIIEAEFPWFNGTIGVYGSTMSIDGGKAETSLQIDSVDLGKLLGYLNVEGLSGAGVIEGVLPLSFEGGRARVNNGILSSKGLGVIRYQGKATAAAAQSNEQSALAFEILRELRFEKLSATIDGPLDGTLKFKVLFEGRSDIPVKAGKETQRVDSPVKYRITIDAPLLSLIEQAILSTDVKLQIERAQKSEVTEKGVQ